MSTDVNTIINTFDSLTPALKVSGIFYIVGIVSIIISGASFAGAGVSNMSYPICFKHPKDKVLCSFFNGATVLFGVAALRSLMLILLGGAFIFYYISVVVIKTCAKRYEIVDLPRRDPGKNILATVAIISGIVATVGIFVAVTIAFMEAGRVVMSMG